MNGPYSVEGPVLPPDLLQAYRCASCLKGDGHSGTYLCEEKQSGRKVIVKITDDEETARQIENEYRLLRLIEESGHPQAARFPKALRLERSGDALLYIRSYIPGRSIEALTEAQPGRPGLPRQEALSYTASVLSSLSFLHGMRPPIIHRDIKPQNVVADGSGNCCLIDLGISRTPRKGGETDTQVFGTRLTAPPEQFGYRQTDARSDIYSAGVLLRYCLTGEYREEADEGLDEDIRTVIRRATQFDPDLRYQRAEDMLDALKQLQKEKPSVRGKRRLIVLWTALICAVGLALAFLLPRGQKNGFDGRGVYHFYEPLIEQAVRRELNAPDAELRADDLAKVKSLHVIGRQLYDSEDQIWFLGKHLFMRDEKMRDDGLWEQNGGIASLKDIEALPGLRELCLYRQEISDLSALQGTAIERLGIGYNPVTDLSPLAGNENIAYLNVSCLELTAADGIAALPNLRSLSLGGVPLPSLKGLETLPLESLNLFEIAATEYGPLAQMQSLNELTLGKLDWHILDMIAETHISSLTVTHANGVPLRELEALPTLQSLYYYTDDPLELSGEPLRFPNMEWIDLKNLHLPSFACLSGMPKLKTLCIYASSFDSCAGLDALADLKSIYCTAEQARILSESYPENGWRLVY